VKATQMRLATARNGDVLRLCYACWSHSYAGRPDASSRRLMAAPVAHDDADRWL